MFKKPNTFKITVNHVQNFQNNGQIRFKIYKAVKKFKNETSLTFNHPTPSTQAPCLRTTNNYWYTKCRSD